MWLGYHLERLEWALATIKDPAQLATFVEPFRTYAQVLLLEDIGNQAIGFHNTLGNYQGTFVIEADLNILRDARSSWQTLALERLGDLFLITPTTVIDPKSLLGGLETLLTAEARAFLTTIETSDLTESVGCLLVGSATAAELMALRAAENFMRRWYEMESGQVAGRKAWKTLLDWFNKKPFPHHKDVKRTIALLNYLNIRRNEVAHPDQVSDLGSAQITLMNVCGLIIPVGSFLTQQPPASQSEPNSNEE